MSARSLRPALLGLTLLAFALRSAALGTKGLSYDEAATALMARATPGAIVRFHWQAAFEHPPLWQLLLRGWSLPAGQSEFALRFLSALAGTLAVPLAAALARRFWPRERSAVLTGTLLVALSPALLLYSQEARMYAPVVALALALIGLALELVRRRSAPRLTAFVLLSWAMLGLHYYSVLLLGLLGLFALVEAVRSRRDPGREPARAPVDARHAPLRLLAGVAVGVLPLLCWMLFAPGFGDTLAVVLRFAGGPRAPVAAFLDELWRNLSFGAVRWMPPQAVSGYLLLPLVLLGLLLALRRRGPAGEPGWLLVLLAVLPIAISALAFGTLATRYLLWLLPLLLLAAGLALAWLAERNAALGAAALLLAAVPCALGLAHYFGAYTKSAYREMAQTLAAQAAPDDLVLLEAPRQHLLWRYYGPPALAWEPVPAIELPAFWPVNAPPLLPHETDDQLQRALREHSTVWLVLTSENEVDAGEFVPEYLQAVAYREECRAWLDVRLCRFRSPAATPVAPPAAAPGAAVLPQAVGAGLWLDGVATGRPQTSADGSRFLPVRLDWRAAAQPAADLKASLRLEDARGTLWTQTDELPIGPLLPPTTWAAGDEKPGYFVLALPPDLAGPATLRLLLYDPVTGAPAGDPLVLGSVSIDP